MPSEQNGEQFFTKLGELPVVNDGWTVALNYYSRLKEYNALTKLALDATESGVKKAAEVSTPVLSHFQPQIDSVNTYACNTLDVIEQKYPLVKQPTQEIKDSCVEYVQPAVDKVKPVVTYVQGVVDNGKKQVGRIKSASTNLVSGARDLGVNTLTNAVTGARDLGVNTLTHAVTRTLETPPGRLVTRTVDGVLTCADTLMDRCLPEETSEGASPQNKDEGFEDTVKRVEPMEEMEPSPQRVAVHLQSVSRKLRERMFRRAMKDFHAAKVRTLDTVSKLQHAVDLIDYAKKNLDSAKGKIEDLWTQITDSQEENIENSSALTAEERVVWVGRTLASRLKSGISALEQAYNAAGQFVRHPITRSREYTEFIYHLSTDVRNMSMEKARDTLHSIQAKLKNMIDRVESPEWLAVDIQMEGLSLEEEELSSAEASEGELEPQGNHI